MWLNSVVTCVHLDVNIIPCCRSEEANVYSTMLARWQNDVITPGREEELRTLRLENARLRDQLTYHSSAGNV